MISPKTSAAKMPSPIKLRASPVKKSLAVRAHPMRLEEYRPRNAAAPGSGRSAKRGRLPRL